MPVIAEIVLLNILVDCKSSIAFNTRSFLPWAVYLTNSFISSVLSASKSVFQLLNAVLSNLNLSASLNTPPPIAPPINEEVYLYKGLVLK